MKVFKLVDGRIGGDMTLCFYERDMALTITALMGFFANKGELNYLTVCEGGRAVERQMSES